MMTFMRRLMFQIPLVIALALTPVFEGGATPLKGTWKLNGNTITAPDTPVVKNVTYSDGSCPSPMPVPNYGSPTPSSYTLTIPPKFDGMGNPLTATVVYGHANGTGTWTSNPVASNLMAQQVIDVNIIETGVQGVHPKMPPAAVACCEPPPSCCGHRQPRARLLFGRRGCR